jgi:hypothetical protein
VAIGLAVLTALLNTGIRSKFSQIPGYGTEFQAPHGSEGYTALHELTGETKEQVLSAFAAAFKVRFHYQAFMFLADELFRFSLVG